MKTRTAAFLFNVLAMLQPSATSRRSGIGPPQSDVHNGDLHEKPTRFVVKVR